MLSRLAQKLWGDFSSTQECAKFIRLAVIFAFTIGVFWIINPTKEVIFLHTVGRDYLAYVKIVSLCIMIPAILAYGRLVDLFPRHRIFYVLCVFYGIGTLIFAFFIMHPTIGIANTALSTGRLLGWLWYPFVESFGSIIVALFWTFASDTSTPESAKRGFSIIAWGAQVGGFLSPLLMYNVSSVWNPAVFVMIGGMGMFCIALLMFYFMWATPADQLRSYSETHHEKKAKPGFFEGLRLIISVPYLLGIAGVVTLYEVIVTVLEFHVKTLAAITYHGDINALNAFFFHYALYANGIALLCLALGAGAIGRGLGLLKTLLLLPILVACCLGVITVHFTLMTTLVVFVTIKGLNYALNQPAKEQLYIPTSHDSKYKAKAWIDMFGARAAKSVGSAVHILRPMLQSGSVGIGLGFVGVSSLICYALLIVWVLAAVFVGKKHAQAVKDDTLIC